MTAAAEFLRPQTSREATRTQDRFVNNVAVCRPIGTVSATIAFAGCSNARLVPFSHAIGLCSDGRSTIICNANPQTCQGGCHGSWSATLDADELSTPGHEGEVHFFGGRGGAGPARVNAAGRVSADGTTVEGSDSCAIGGLGLPTFHW
jgi:hypothetical protein